MESIKAQDKGKQAKKVFAQLEQQRQPLERYWRDAYTYTLPHRGQYFQTKQADGVTGANNAQAQQARIFDSTAGDAVSLLASSIMGGLTPSSSQWFQFRIPGYKFENLPYDARVWLEDSAKTLFNQIHNASNYNATALEALEDMAISGMFGLYVSKEKDDSGNFTFELWPLDSMYVVENPETQVIDTIYRVCLYTAAAAVEEFGEAVPEGMMSAYRNNPDDPKQYEFLHVIRPRRGKPGKFASQMPFEALYVCKKSGKLVKESGYQELPVIVPRWSKIPRTSYAVGPINKALPDVKTINKIVEMMLQNAEMAISGTYVAKADGYLNPNTIKIGPRRVVFAQDPGNIKPLTTGGDFRIAFEEITRLKTQIKSVMMADELEPIQKNYASATEVSTRAVIVRQILGPIFARLQSEFLEPLIARCFNLAMRDGTLGQPPEILQGVSIIPEYISPMARAQRMEEVTAMEKFEQSLAGTAQLNHSVLDLYDFDAAQIKKAQLLGVPSDVIRSKEQIRKIRDEQAKAQAQAQQQAQQQQMQEKMLTNPEMLKLGVDVAGGPEKVREAIKGTA